MRGSRAFPLAGDMSLSNLQAHLPGVKRGRHSFALGSEVLICDRFKAGSRPFSSALMNIHLSLLHRYTTLHNGRACSGASTVADCGREVVTVSSVLLSHPRYASNERKKKGRDSAYTNGGPFIEPS